MITQLTSGSQSGMFGPTASSANVQFSPGCDNNWWPYWHLGHGGHRCKIVNCHTQNANRAHIEKC